MRVVGIIIFFLFGGNGILHSQTEPIYFLNPSFEGKPGVGNIEGDNLPDDIKNCGFKNETSPDMHPLSEKVFGVRRKASNGKTCIGFVTRDNFTWESVSQELSESLQAGNCYKVSVDLGRTENLKSFTRKDRLLLNFKNPLVLRIFGGNSHCDKQQLVVESVPIENVFWKTYSFEFHADDNYSHLSFEAYYDEEKAIPYNGNLFMDNLSPIEKIECSEKIEQKNSVLQSRFIAGLQNRKEVIDKLKNKLVALKENNGSKQVLQFIGFDDSEPDYQKLKSHLQKFIEIYPFNKWKLSDLGKAKALNISNTLKDHPQFGVIVALKHETAPILRSRRARNLRKYFRMKGILESKIIIQEFHELKGLIDWTIENEEMAAYIFFIKEGNFIFPKEN